MQEGRKVVAGTQDGVLNIYNWAEWGDMNDRMIGETLDFIGMSSCCMDESGVMPSACTADRCIAGHPQSIDSIVKIDEDTIATGSSDGLIRCTAPHLTVSRALLAAVIMEDCAGSMCAGCRLVQLLPNKFLGVLGEHGDDPIERIRVCDWSLIVSLQRSPCVLALCRSSVPLTHNAP